MAASIRLALFAVVMSALAIAPLAANGHRPAPMVRYAAKAIGGGRRRGRPRKFNRPSRAVTLTLPDDVLAALHAIDSDLSRAVVRAAQPFIPKTPGPPAELTMFGDRAVIVVPPNLRLKERTGVELIPLSDGRALISLDEGLSIADIELRLRDALADPSFDRADRAVFEALADILSNARRADGVTVRRRSIIVLHGVRQGSLAS
jgi:hypothetical protein